MAGDVTTGSQLRLYRVLLLLCLGIAGRGSPAQGAGLREMLQEVGALLDDTQGKLRDAAREMDLEPKRAVWDPKFIPKNQRRESSSRLGTGELSDGIRQDARKECIVDEDCGKDHFCQTHLMESKCFPQRAGEENCSRDGQCTWDHLCIWGECQANAERGQLGSICEQQEDCAGHLCCAFHPNLLFPVCTPLAEREQPCRDPDHQWLDFITWEMEPFGSLDKCPCSKGLLCLREGDALTPMCKDGTRATAAAGLPSDKGLPPRSRVVHGVSKDGEQDPDCSECHARLQRGPP
ncbi:dickkopf-related protein 3b [Narcine bancroftii]|uniref:dickkopf-related protein 3b n=1 Tax=Narcine bancroftii TaxID=1343680 RepID=UPI0038310BCB